jgi:DNA-binding CsgD family transcriptional regulator
VEGASSFVAREDELARALHAVRVGSGVLVAGEAGIGKTSLAARIADRIAAGGDPVVWTVATKTSRAVPFGALGPLLPPDLGSVHPTLIPHAIVRTLRERGSRARVLLVVDDAQWLDEHSATAVLDVVTQRAATVLATVRTGVPAPDAVTALWKDGLLERVDVGAFDLDGTRALLVDRLGGEVTNLTVATLWERTGGNPLYLTELVRFGQAEGRFTRDGSVCWWQGELGVPPRLAELLDRRFHRLSTAARDVVGALALGQPLPLDTLAAIAPGQALEEVEERGLVTSDARQETVQLRFAHPLLAAVATRTLSPTRRRRLATALAATTGDWVDVVRRASWQLDAADPPDVDVLLAGAAAVQLTDPALAGRFAKRALPHDPGPRAALALANSHGELGRPRQAREAVLLAAARVRTDQERVAVGFGDISVTFWSERDSARALADLRALRGSVPAEFAADIEAVRALLTTFSARPAEAQALAEQVLAGNPPHLAAVRASTAKIGALVLADRADAAIALSDRVLATLTDEPVTPYAVGMVHAMAAWARLIAWADPPPTAGVAAGPWPVPDATRRDAPDAPVAWPLLDGVRWHIQGKLPEAESRLREAFTQQRQGEGVFRTEVTTGLAVVLAETGQPQAATRLLDTEPPDAVAVIPQTTTWARAAIEAARGNRAGAAARALAAAAEAAEVGAVVTALWYLADAGRYGDPAGAQQVLHTLPAAFESPLSQARAAGIHARAAAAPPALLNAAEQHAAIGVWGEALDLAERAVAAPGSAAPTQRARAALLAGELRARLNRPAPAARPATALTARELEVARLAAHRMTNHQIADTLVVSVRTVESHLAAAYRKLGIQSRHQLDQALNTG